MGKYQNTGKQVLYVEGDKTTHIADAGNNEMSHLIATTLNERSDNYIQDALRTLSPSWHGDKVAKAQFLGRVNGAIDAASRLDALKKTLFYGRDNNLIAEGQTNAVGYADAVGGGSANGANTIHAIIGIFTEAGELLEGLRDNYNGAPSDSVNMREEVGDLFWYIAILANECGFNFEEAMRVNIAKLRGRFPDKFSETNANERNLAAERAILEEPYFAHMHGDVVEHGTETALRASVPLADNVSLSAHEAAIIESGGITLSTGDVATTEPAMRADVRVNGISMHADWYGKYKTPTTPLIAEAPTASGKAAVERAAESSAQAFNNVGNVSKSEPEPMPSDPTGETAKFPGARLNDLPGESYARIPRGDCEDMDC